MKQSIDFIIPKEWDKEVTDEEFNKLMLFDSDDEISIEDIDFTKYNYKDITVEDLNGNTKES